MRAMARYIPLQPLFSPRALNAKPRAYHRGLRAGLALILSYYRLYGVRTLTAGQVVRRLAGRDIDAGKRHGLKTWVGWGFRHLERLGLVVAWNNGKPTHYIPTPMLYLFLEEHPCLKGCSTDSTVCSLYGSPWCPFLRGLGGGEDGADG